MAELIHTFTSGKMNKDLDERLVPNGEYRDALNLELASSDTSQVGTFQNIKGNLELRNKTYNPKTNAYNQWLNADYITALSNPVCVGAKADENSNDVYWFIASANTSVIAYYNSKTKLTKPLIVDTQGILNFSENYLITGINVIEGILIWTDNQTEPKKIFIEDWKNSTPNFVTHSQIYSRNFIEDDITVIKKYPLQPPVTVAYSTRQANPDGSPGANVDTQTLTSFVYQPPGSPAGTIAPMPPNYLGEFGSGVQLNWQSAEPPVYYIGNILLLTNSENDPLDVDAVVRVEVLGVGAGTALVEILSVGKGDEILTTQEFLYDVTLEQDSPFFEMRFARFGYRYKYKNNEISAFSPFSNPVFIPGKFNYSPSQGYNLGMTNNVRQLTISDFVPSPIDYPDVVSVDILYKATNNQNVYVVDTFTNEDPEWTAGEEKYPGTPEAYFVGAFNIETEIITSVVNTNQILRPFDNVPRKALAQEITANRLLFGNYTQNFNLLNNDGSSFQTNITVGSTHRVISTEADEFGQPVGINIDGNQVANSVKSIRTYQIGVAYMDKYGRTTPVFTSKEASYNLSKSEAASANSLTVRLEGNDNNGTLIPYYEQNKQFPYFKYYVKETSREYYNLALDRFYDAEDGNLWLSFPSAERNKVDEDTFLILKKGHDTFEPVVETARYKVIAIENEAPTYLKETRLSMGTMDAGGFDIAGFPIENTNEVQVLTSVFNEQFGVEARTLSGLLLRVKVGTSVSNYYKISAFGIDGGNVKITTAEPFGPDMNFTSTVPYGFANRVDGLQLELIKVESQNKPEFTGRFFVKVFQDDLIRREIAGANNVTQLNYVRKALGELYEFEGEPGGTLYNSAGFWKDGPGNFRWKQPDAQNAEQRLFIDTIRTRGLSTTGKGLGTHGIMEVSYAGGLGNKRRTSGLYTRNKPLYDQLMSDRSLFRFVDAGNGKKDPQGTVYEVYNSTANFSTCYNSSRRLDNQITRFTLSFRVAGSAWEGLQWDPRDEANGGIRTWAGADSANAANYIGLEFVEEVTSDNSFTTNNPAIFETEPKEAAELDIYWEVPKVYKTSEYTGQIHTLDFFNCYSFGNGVESDRIRDDFNQPTIENGVKASATLDEPYNEEIRSSGVIFSQIFNSISGVNNLNQFIQAESITKDLNPEYGSIQKFHTRDTDLITLCENKSMKILAKKDILFNADGSTNLTSNAAVLGQTVPFQGEFGIAKNPESFAEFGFRMYYTDATRGAVLRLSGDGLTDLSDYGMHSFFSDNLPINNKILGTWDPNKRNYNITLNSLTPYWQQTLGAGEFDRLNKDPLCDQFVNSLPTTTTTVSYKEAVNGFTSRKVYIPEAGAYLDNAYYTFKSGRIWEHGTNEKRNTFYNIGPDTPSTTLKSGNPYYESSFNTIFNENPAVIKGYKTLNYSGTKSKEYVYKVGTSLQEYSLAQIQAQRLVPTSSSRTKGWYVNSILTDLQEGEIKEFVKKEGKYFNYIKGMPTFFTTNCDTNVDSSEFNVQGIGRATKIEAPGISRYNVINEVDPDCSTSISPPVIYNQNFEVVEDLAGTFNIVQSNTCTSAITFQLGTDSTTSGVFTFNTAGSFTFDPDTDYNGSAGSFTVRACCGDVCSNYAVMSIIVTPVPDNPYFSSDVPALNSLVDGDTWSYPNITLLDNDHPSSQLFINTVVGMPSWMAQPVQIAGSDQWEIPTSTVSGGASTINFTMIVEDPDGNQGEQQVTGTVVDLPVPDTTRVFITTWRRTQYGAITNIEPESSAQDAKCLIDDFYEIQNQEYNLISNGYGNSPVSFKFFGDGVDFLDGTGVVGTQMYDTSTNAPITSGGAYLFASGAPELNPQMGETGLDPTNSDSAPASFFMMVLDSSGIVVEYVQYNQLAVCSDPCLMWPIDTGIGGDGYRMEEGYTSEGYSINLSEYANYTTAFCQAYTTMLNWEANPNPPCTYPPIPNCKQRGTMSTRVFWYQNTCDPNTSPFFPTENTILFERGLFNPDINYYNYHPLVNRRFILGPGLFYSSDYWKDLGVGYGTGDHWLVETDSTGLCTRLEKLVTTNWDYTACP
jgi:hypothetical protein